MDDFKALGTFLADSSGFKLLVDVLFVVVAGWVIKRAGVRKLRLLLAPPKANAKRSKMPVGTTGNRRVRHAQLKEQKRLQAEKQRKTKPRRLPPKR